MFSPLRKSLWRMVVPHEGTWIEMLLRQQAPLFFQSFPTRERGLKYCQSTKRRCLVNVVPHEGTWIEMYLHSYFPLRSLQSFPTRERGLKYELRFSKVALTESFPTRERGLKSFPTAQLSHTPLSFPTRERGLK